MNPASAILIFAGIPVAAAAVIALCVYAPSWSRRHDSSVEAIGGPVVITSAPANPNPSLPPRELDASNLGGGASVRW